jgi:hypothetical protein
MKITVCALAAVAVSLAHALLKPDCAPSGHPPTARPAQTEIMAITNFTNSSDGLCAITPTESNVVYQAYTSTDRAIWTESGQTFTGNGNLRLIPLETNITPKPSHLFVRVEIL